MNSQWSTLSTGSTSFAKALGCHQFSQMQCFPPSRDFTSRSKACQDCKQVNYKMFIHIFENGIFKQFLVSVVRVLYNIWQQNKKFCITPKTNFQISLSIYCSTLQHIIMILCLYKTHSNIVALLTQDQSLKWGSILRAHKMFPQIFQKK